ncbi:uncharacterized protein LOC135163968 [Diachasmimorpha longicaudata]|uniref:uncharacterized protein LOC135163968 n=1 Tax=Diachasmimorpha longicaudata TaxID=58733 RepID=UPI0030B8EB32
MQIKDKKAVILGPVNRLGIAFCRELLRNGAGSIIILTDQQSVAMTAVEEINQEFGQKRLIWLPCDISKNELDVAFKEAVNTLGGLDILINNVDLINESDIMKAVDVNVTAVIRSTLLGVQQMGKDLGGRGGIIVNVASIVGFEPLPQLPVYSTTKQAVISFSRSFAQPYHYQRTGVKIIVLSPGVSGSSARECLEILKSPTSTLGSVTVHPQRVETVAHGLVYAIRCAQNGSIWVSEDGQPVYEIKPPDVLPQKQCDTDISDFETLAYHSNQRQREPKKQRGVDNAIRLLSKRAEETTFLLMLYGTNGWWMRGVVRSASRSVGGVIDGSQYSNRLPAVLDWKFISMSRSSRRKCLVGVDNVRNVANFLEKPDAFAGHLFGNNNHRNVVSNSVTLLLFIDSLSEMILRIVWIARMTLPSSWMHAHLPRYRSRVFIERKGVIAMESPITKSRRASAEEKAKELEIIKGLVCGKNVVITGGAAGLGYAFVNHFLQNGAKTVVIMDVDAAAGERAVKAIAKSYGGRKIIFLHADTSNFSQVLDAFKHVSTIVDSIDIVINNAGILDERRWEREIAVNIGGMITVATLAMRFMSKDQGANGGVLVNIAQYFDFTWTAQLPVYTATKYAIIGLSQSLGAPYHYERTGVRVMALCPGLTETALTVDSPNRLLSKFMKADFVKNLEQMPIQTPFIVSEGLMSILKCGDSGSIWAVENGKTPFEISTPHYSTQKRCYKNNFVVSKTVEKVRGRPLREICDSLPAGLTGCA